MRVPLPLIPPPPVPEHDLRQFRPHRRSPLPRRQRPRAEQHDNRYGDQAEESVDPVSLSSDEMQGRRLRGAGSGQPTAAGRLPGRPRSQGDECGQRRKQRRRRGDVGDGGREARTWRGRLEAGSGVDQSKGKGVDKGPSLASGKKFEDLDNYLRGCASVSVAKREKRKRRLGQGTGGDSYGGTMTDGSSSSLAERHEVRIGSTRGG